MNQNIKDFMPSVKIEAMPHNTEFHYFHTRALLIEKNKWYSTEYNEMFDKEYSEMNYLTKVLIGALHEIDGVKMVNVRPYKLGVEKSEIYTWDELYPKIKLVLAKYLPVERNCFVTR